MTAPTPSAGVLPASFAQELLWYLDRASPGLTAYNIPRARRLRGKLDVGALSQALDALVERHEILRTTYAEREGAVVQIIHPPRSAELPLVDLSGRPATEREPEATGILNEAGNAPFDLIAGPMLRCLLVRLSPDDHALLLATHHIASDGWSGPIMFQELFQLYEARRTGTPATLPELPIQYGDYAAWQREELAGDRLGPLLDYWRGQFAGQLPVLELPTDRPRAAVPSFAGDRRVLELPAPLADQLRKLGQRHGASLYMVLLAAYQTLLHRLSGQDDILVGSPIAGRDRAETEGLIGYFANTLVYRSRFSDDPTFDQLLDQVRDTCLGAFDHHELPLERLVLELRGSGQLSEGSLFRVVFTQLDTTSKGLTLPELSVEPEALSSETVKFDFTLFLADRPELVRLVLFFRTDLFDGDRIDRVLAEFRTLLEAIAAAPETRVSALPLLPAAEQSALAEWNRTNVTLGPPTTMVALILAAGQRNPGLTAVVAGDTALTWAELLSRAGKLAHYLQGLGVGPDVTVGLCLERSTDLIVGMTGILLAGGAYVPLLPELPRARLEQQLAESGATIVVTRSPADAALPAGIRKVRLDADAAALDAAPATSLPDRATPASLAYVLFTSGSTGVPKGVAVTHGNLVHYTRAIASVLGLQLSGGGPPWQCASVSTLAADLGHTSVFPALASGGTLHLLADGVVLDAAQFQAYATAHPLDLLKITPSHFQALVGPEPAPAHLPRRWLVLGGEACPWSLAESVRAAGVCRVLNHYGPTETTVGACTFELGAGDVRSWSPATVPIGRPLPNMTAHVLDAHQQPVPVGVPGELWLGGAGVARGYLGREELTGERFVTHTGERRYRTGDQVRRLPTGDIEFLGRLDQQVKVRGHRVELGEIEAVLSRHGAVRQAVVLHREDRLVSYLVLAAPCEDAALVAHLSASLPEHMVPAVWVRLESLPLTANGKLDRKALPDPVPAPDPAGGRVGDPPRSDFEIRVAAIWVEVLKTDSVGRNDNFFSRGGHSLLAIRLLGKIAKQFGVRLPLRTLFEAPTLAGFAEVLDLEMKLAAVEAMAGKNP